MGLVSKKLRDSAKGQPCTFGTPWCNHDPATTVLCHIRDETKGMGNKALDVSAAFGCSACHEVIDQHRMLREHEIEYCLRAMQRTWRIWVEMGLITIAGANEKPRKPSSKTIARRPLTVQP